MSSRFKKKQQHFRFERRGRGPHKKRTQQHDVNVKALAQLMPHRREVKQPELRHDAKAESILGRMQLNGYIDVDQYEAAMKLKRCVRRMRRVLNAPNDELGALPLDGLRGGGDNDVDPATADEWRAQHKRVYDDLLANVGQRITRLLTRVVVNNYSVLPEERDDLKRGLDRLVQFYGLQRISTALVYYTV